MRREAIVPLAASVLGAGLSLFALSYVFVVPSSVLYNSDLFGALAGNGTADASVTLMCASLLLAAVTYASALRRIDSRRVPLALSLLAGLVVLFYLCVADFVGNRYVMSRGLSAYSAGALGLCVAVGVSRFRWAMSSLLLVPASFLSAVTVLLYVAGISTVVSGGVPRASGGSHDTLGTASVLCFFLVSSFGYYVTRAAPRSSFRIFPLAMGLNAVAMLSTLSWSATFAASIGCITIGFMALSRRQAVATTLVCVVLTSGVLFLRTESPSGSLSNRASKAGRLRLAQVSLDRTVKALPLGEGLHATAIEIRNPVTGELASSEAPFCAPLFMVQQFGIVGILVLLAIGGVGVRAAQSLAGAARKQVLGIALALGFLLCVQEVFLTVGSYGIEVTVAMFLGGIVFASPPSDQRSTGVQVQEEALA